jgi:CubicO group peptidase (beta-lactamase class C family)
MPSRGITRLAALALVLSVTGCASAPGVPTPAEIDQRVRNALAETRANGMAIAVVDDGRVGYVQAYGLRNARGEPLLTDTVMYGASITKTVMAYTALTLVDQGKLDLDAPLAGYLERPLISYGEGEAHLAKYGPYRDLAGDDRWRKITARMALTHSTGFHNFWFIEPDQKLRIHFEPGSRYSYSGEGFSLLQFTIENGAKAKGLGLDVKDLTDAIFARLGMTLTGLQWRPDFRPNLADGWNDKGEAVEHDERSNVRAAGSMDTTISDLSTFIAALVRGEGLSARARAEMVKPSLHIGTAHQFPNFGADLPAGQQRRDLAAGLGVIVFDGPQGPGFYKGGHDGQTANSFVCVERVRRCVLLLANDVRAEARFADLVRFVLGETGVPYDWEYGDHAGKS